MAGQTTVTTAMKRKIRELYALGVPLTKIARDFNLHHETVRRHASDEFEKKIKAQQRKRYEKERTTQPEVVERRRAKAREYAAKKREEYVKNPRKKLPTEVTADEFARTVLAEDKVLLDNLGGE